MAASELMIDGKKYVSSGRAAQLIGYTKDYVGQLARAGKVECQMIGRSWYVSEDSIQKHKLNVHYTLKNPKKPRKNKETKSLRGSEKTKQSKVISDTTPDTGVGSLASNEADTHDDATVRKHVSRDVLAQSDILYKSEPPLTFEDEAPERPSGVGFSTKDGPSSWEDADPEPQAVPIRVPRPVRPVRRSRPVVSSRSVPVAGIDGVGAPRPDLRRKRRLRETYEQVESEYVQPDVPYVSVDQRVEYRDEVYEEPQQTSPKSVKTSHRSKAVPVLGALVVLALFVLGYLLLW